ncbi:MAG: DUF438 domain-containing protein [Spirochaetales bacterium]|nr:DUF438 domain-containing protein [Spirochaetales bacterium]
MPIIGGKMISGSSDRNRLFEYLEGLFNGNTTRAWYDEYAENLAKATPRGVNDSIDALIKMSDDFDRIERSVARFIKASGQGLDKAENPVIPADHYLNLFIEENRYLKELLTQQTGNFKIVVSFDQQKPEYKEAKAKLFKLLLETKAVKPHYLKIQYSLFPAYEDCSGEFRCVKLMWHIQDGILKDLNTLLKMMQNTDDWSSTDFNRIYGKLFLNLSTLIYQEEKILFPLAFRMIPAGRFTQMCEDIDEYGGAFGIETKKYKEKSMSENLKNHEERKEILYKIIQNLKDEKDIHSMKKEFRSILKDLSPEEIAEAEQSLISEGVPVEEVQKLCELHVAAFEDALKKSVKREKITKVLPGHPVDTYKKENKALKQILKKFKKGLKAVRSEGNVNPVKEVFSEISKIENHFTRKENQLFPYLESVNFTGPSKVMWGKHDEIRLLLKEFNTLIESGDTKSYVNKGKEIIPAMKRMIFMEEKILFPTALRKLPESAWIEMRKGENEIGYSWVAPGNLWDPSVIREASPAISEGPEIELSVGKLMPDQIDLMLKNLPFDITFVDENDKVRYYSQGKERIFPRSPGIIGRDVQNCHPPKSVHVVQKIVEDFKAKKRDEAEFWLQMGGKFIHIRYFPLFDNGEYRGVIEVSQDLTPLRALEGERRLLDD